MGEFQLTHTSGRQQKSLTIPDAVYTVLWAPDDGQKNCLKHVEHWKWNKDYCITLHILGCVWEFTGWRSLKIIFMYCFIYIFIVCSRKSVKRMGCAWDVNSFMAAFLFD
jgi:hypothetical protein